MFFLLFFSQVGLKINLPWYTLNFEVKSLINTSRPYSFIAGTYKLGPVLWSATAADVAVVFSFQKVWVVSLFHCLQFCKWRLVHDHRARQFSFDSSHISLQIYTKRVCFGPFWQQEAWQVDLIRYRKNGSKFRSRLSCKQMFVRVVQVGDLFTLLIFILIFSSTFRIENYYLRIIMTKSWLDIRVGLVDFYIKPKSKILTCAHLFTRSFSQQIFNETKKMSTKIFTFTLWFYVFIDLLQSLQILLHNSPK